MDKYLITLTGMGSELECCLVDKDIWDWINNNTQKIPEFLKNEFKTTQSKYGGTLQNLENELLDIEDSGFGDMNDKALFVVGCFDWFSSIMEINKYCRDNNINIIGEYVGAIY